MNYDKIFKLAHKFKKQSQESSKEVAKQNFTGQEKKNWDKFKKYIDSKFATISAQSDALDANKSATFQQYADLGVRLVNLINSAHINSSIVLGLAGFLFAKAALRSTGKTRTDYSDTAKKYLLEASQSQDGLSSPKNIQGYLYILKQLDEAQSLPLPL
jgi:hypothetical protein